MRRTAWFTMALAAGIAAFQSTSPRCIAADGPEQAAGEVNLSETLQALDAGEGKVAELAEDLEGVPVTTPAEAQQICAMLKTLPHAKGSKVPTRPVLDALLLLFQQVESASAYDVLQTDGTPELIRIYQRLSASRDAKIRHSMMLLLKIAAMYHTEAGTKLVIAAAKEPYQPENDFWSVILDQFDARHPQARELVKQLSTPLPQGMIAVALLDAVNDLESAGEEFPHPFDTEAGIGLLKAWLSSENPDQYSRAVSAAATLPYLKQPERDELLKLALNHPDEEVQLEGAFASADMKSGDGLERLVKFCSDVRYARQAERYLEELGEASKIPASAKEPKFAATAKMCDWLADAHEYGAPPDKIELVDTRKLFWPPTKDTRTVWLFKFEYDADKPTEQPVVGLGMVGSVTFALDGENSPDHTPAEMYALHCCWELQVAHDPRAPKDCSVEAGMAILKQKNPNLAP